MCMTLQQSCMTATSSMGCFECSLSAAQGEVKCEIFCAIAHHKMASIGLMGITIIVSLVLLRCSGSDQEALMQTLPVLGKRQMDNSTLWRTATKQSQPSSGPPTESCGRRYIHLDFVASMDVLYFGTHSSRCLHGPCETRPMATCVGCAGIGKQLHSRKTFASSPSLDDTVMVMQSFGRSSLLQKIFRAGSSHCVLHDNCTSLSSLRGRFIMWMRSPMRV